MVRMSCNNRGLFKYGVYPFTFLLALCMSTYVLLKYYLICLTAFVIFKTVTTTLNRYLLRKFDPQNRGVFITGCDTDKTGFTVFAGCLNKRSAGAQSLLTTCSSRTHVVEVNTTRQESVTDAFIFVKDHLPSKGLCGIINNAGMDMLGDVELTPISLYKKGFELNLYGYIRVIKTFLPLIRHSKGRVLSVSSVRGRVSEPNQSNYITAKHGIETLTDSLRLEMIKFGVKVCIIEPGDFSNATAIGSEAVTKRKQLEINEMWELARDEVKQSYSKKYMDSWIDPPADSRVPKADITLVAEAVVHALCSVFPKHRYIVQGKWSIVPFDSWVLTYAHNFLPTWIMDKYMSIWKKRLVYAPTEYTPDD